MKVPEGWMKLLEGCSIPQDWKTNQSERMKILDCWVKILLYQMKVPEDWRMIPEDQRMIPECWVKIPLDKMKVPENWMKKQPSLAVISLKLDMSRVHSPGWKAEQSEGGGQNIQGTSDLHKWAAAETSDPAAEIFLFLLCSYQFLTQEDKIGSKQVYNHTKSMTKFP